MEKEILRQIVYRQKNQISNLNKENYVEREILKQIITFLNDDRILILTGIRRSGKSTILKLIMAHLKENLSYCYVNFEDERFINFKAEEFELLNEVLIEVYGNSNYYFFDEIQNIEKFELFIRRLQDENKKIIITGSNASLLSKELGTRLTGRYKLFEIYPFSFIEFLRYNNFKIFPKNEQLYNIEKKVQLQKLFQEYMIFGGFPEYLKNKDKDYIKTLFENILYRDIIVRYSLKKEKILKDLINILSTNVSSLITYNSLKETLNLANAISVKEYINYLSNSYLFFEVLKFSFSLNKQLKNPRKIYLIDPSFIEIFGYNFSNNFGKIFENIIFLELKRQNKDLFYFSNKHECDFVVKENKKITNLIQVCYTLNEANKEREINGLLEAMNFFNIEEGLIITLEQYDVLKINNKKIKIIPFIKWIFSN
ncbi:MAG: ATP-binding protein [Candidatus Woesearchaeota archaeon]